MGQLFTQTYTNQITSWLMCNSSTFGVWTSHGQTQIHGTHHDPDLEEASTLPLILFSLLSHGAYTQMSFFFETPKLWVSKILKSGLLQFCKPIISYVKFWRRWDFMICFWLWMQFLNFWWLQFSYYMVTSCTSNGFTNDSWLHVTFFVGTCTIFHGVMLFPNL
jgi:hypothetical protein